MAEELAAATGHGHRVAGGRRRMKTVGRRHRVEVVFTDEELEKVRQNAAGSGWSFTAWMAIAALTPPVGDVDEFPLGEREILMREFMRAQRRLQGIAVNVNQLAAAMNTAVANPPPGGLTRAQTDELLQAVERLPPLATAVRDVGGLVRDAVIALQMERQSRRRRRR